MALTPEQMFRIRLEAQKERADKYESAYEGGADGEGFDPGPGEMRYHVHGSSEYGRLNPKVFRCEVCKWYAPMTHFIAEPKYWREKQRELKKMVDKVGIDPFSWLKSRAENFVILRECECRECSKVFYWQGMWTLERYLCPKCYPEWRMDRRNRQARWRYRCHKRYHDKQFAKLMADHDIDITPTCHHCGDKFTPERSTAKFCTARCRVAANRAKSAKSKSVKKRRVRANK